MKKILLCVPLLILCCACNRHTKEEAAPLTEEHEHDFPKINKEKSGEKPEATPEKAEH